MQIDFLQLSRPYGMSPYHAYLIDCFLEKKNLLDDKIKRQ